MRRALTTTYHSLLPLTDSYGSTTSSTVNETGTLLTDITNTGLSAGAGILLLFSCLAAIAGIVMIRHYAR